MKIKLIIFITTTLLSIFIIFYLYNEYTEQKIMLNQKLEEQKLLKNIKNKYAKYIITNKDSNLYIKEKDKFISRGMVSKDINLMLEEVNKITVNSQYFKLQNMPYYIYYDDVNVSKYMANYDDSYKNYIVFNEDIITKNPFNLYDESNNLIFKLDEELSMHIIIKDVDKYFVEYNNQLLYVKKEDIKNTVISENTTESYTDAVASLNYHFFYDDVLGEICNQLICLKASKFEEHLKYLSDNNYYAVKMKDLELFIDGKIRLPKNSVNITIDDGGIGVVAKAIPLLDKYKMNATLFLITVWGNKDVYKSPYLEIHSHGHNIHNPGACSGGQGGAIKCLDRNVLLDDLKTSREILNQTTVFCYPFYEYNDYAISVLKEAGFKMAFLGGDYKIREGANKFKLPRYVIRSSITLNDFIKMIR